MSKTINDYQSLWDWSKDRSSYHFDKWRQESPGQYFRVAGRLEPNWQKDLEIVRGLMNKLKTDGLIDKVQFVLCGFDLRGTITLIDQKTGEQKQRPIKPKESIWYQYEKIFTDDYNLVSEDYKNFLLSFENKEYENFKNEPYRRVWTKPITSYATNYNLFDISLAPLKESTFNRVKSQLKVIEAGFHKKAIIASATDPYTLDLISAVDEGKFNDKGNALLVGSKKNHKDWAKHMKRLIENPNLVEDLGNRLYETVKDKYSLKNVCQNRVEFFKSIK